MIIFVDTCDISVLDIVGLLSTKITTPANKTEWYESKEEEEKKQKTAVRTNSNQETKDCQIQTHTCREHCFTLTTPNR